MRRSMVIGAAGSFILTLSDVPANASTTKGSEATGKGVSDAEFHGAAPGYVSKWGIARIMISSNNGTVKAISPCAGLKIITS